MPEELESEFLDGRLLVAMPDMPDPHFMKTVILLVFHSDAGAMGVIVNRPAGQVRISEFVKGEESMETLHEAMPIHFGGPVDRTKALIIIHSTDCRKYSSTHFLNDDLGITSTPDILEDISGGTGPSSTLFVFGYAGWAPGQLEHELQQNSWLVCDSTPELVFEVEASERWDAAIKSLGISPSHLSAGGGTA